jgi:hypothetical protein
MRTTRHTLQGALLQGALAMSAFLLASCAAATGYSPGAQGPSAQEPGPARRDHRTPRPPEDFRLTRQTNEAISLSWRDSSVNENGFVVERRAAGAPVRILSVARAHRAEARTGDVLTFTDTGLTRDTVYCYRVKAYNENGHAGSDERCGRTTNVVIRDHRTR